MEKKSVLFISGNFYPEPTGIGKDAGEMVDWLAMMRYKCSVITTYPYYPYWEVQSPYKISSFWYKKEIKSATINSENITVYRCPHYVPKHPNGIKRIIADFTFFMSVFFLILRLLFKKKYEYVIIVAPPFIIGLLGLLYKKVKGSKLLYHIEDLQIDAAQSLKMIRHGYTLKILYAVERYILSRADVVSSISLGMINRIKAKCKRNIDFFPNWVDLDSLYPLQNKDELKKKFKIDSQDKVVLYSGAIGEKQGLESMIDAAYALKHLSNVKFIICGTGPYKARLVNLKEKLNLDNVIFLPLQPQENFNKFLNMADIHLVLQKSTASDLVMPSKLLAILSVGGIAIITANKGSSLYEMVSLHKIGVLVDADNQIDLNTAIEKLVSSDSNDIKINARKYAEEFHSIDKNLSKYVKHMQ